MYGKKKLLSSAVKPSDSLAYFKRHLQQWSCWAVTAL